MGHYRDTAQRQRLTAKAYAEYPGLWTDEIMTLAPSGHVNGGFTTTYSEHGIRFRITARMIDSNSGLVGHAASRDTTVNGKSKKKYFPRIQLLNVHERQLSAVSPSVMHNDEFDIEPVVCLAERLFERYDEFIIESPDKRNRVNDPIMRQVVKEVINDDDDDLW